MKLRSLGFGARTGRALRGSLSIGLLVASACTPVDRDFDNGGGGSGGAPQGCEPGTSAPCYTGTPGTEDVGMCHMGTQTCLEDGTGYGACEGEVTPTAEICTTQLDEGCDGPNPVECPSLGHAWSQSFGGNGEELFTSIVVDPVSGDIIGTGYFRDIIDFGGGPMASTGNDDIFLVRFTAEGQHLWSKRFGDGSYQTPRDLALDSQGAIYLVGEAQGSVDFGNGNSFTSKGAEDAFVVKFDPDGNSVWGRMFGDSKSQRGTRIAITPADQVIIAGNFEGIIPLSGLELPSINSTDMFVIRLDGSGFEAGGQRYGGPNNDELMDLTVDSKGATFITGMYSGAADFGSLGTFNAAGDSDAFVLKLKSDLSEEWLRSYGDVTFQRGGAIVTSPNDDVFVMGDFTGTIPLEDGSTLMAPDQQRSIFLLALVSDGTLRWSMSTGNAQSGFARQMLAVDPSSQAIVAVGMYDGSLDFGGGPLDAALVDGFIAKIGWDGAHISSTHLGGPKIDALFDVAVSPTGDVFVGGAHQGPVDVGDGVLETPAGPDDLQALLMRRLP